MRFEHGSSSYFSLGPPSVWKSSPRTRVWSCRLRLHTQKDCRRCLRTSATEQTGRKRWELGWAAPGWSQGTCRQCGMVTNRSRTALRQSSAYGRPSSGHGWLLKKSIKAKMRVYIWTVFVTNTDSSCSMDASTSKWQFPSWVGYSIPLHAVTISLAAYFTPKGLDLCAILKNGSIACSLDRSSPKNKSQKTLLTLTEKAEDYFCLFIIVIILLFYSFYCCHGVLYIVFIFAFVFRSGIYKIHWITKYTKFLLVYVLHKQSKPLES